MSSLPAATASVSELALSASGKVILKGIPAFEICHCPIHNSMLRDRVLNPDN
jgi:hypothetical protein